MPMKNSDYTCVQNAKWESCSPPTSKYFFKFNNEIEGDKGDEQRFPGLPDTCVHWLSLGVGKYSWKKSGGNLWS